MNVLPGMASSTPLAGGITRKTKNYSRGCRETIRLKVVLTVAYICDIGGSFTYLLSRTFAVENNLSLTLGSVVVFTVLRILGR